MSNSIIKSARTRNHLVFMFAAAIILAASVTFADIISGLSTTNSSTNVTVTNLAISKPADVAQGDVMLASIAIHDGSAVSVTAPSGWTQILRTDNETNIGIVSYWKAAGASEPANYTWVLSPQTRAEGGITRYSGVDSANPIDDAAGNFSRSKVATTSPITTTAANEEVVSLFALHVGGNNFAADFFSTPPGMTEKYDASHTAAGPTIASFDMTQVAAGVAGSKSSTISGNPNQQRDWASQQIALRPAPAAHISVETGTNGSTSYAACTSSFQSSYTFSKTVSATSTLLIVHSDSYLTTSVTYGDVSMTLASSTTGGLMSWYLVSPPSGTHDVVVNFSSPSGLRASAVSYTGTDVSNPLGAMGFNHALSGNPSVSVNTVNDNSVVDDNVYYDYGQSLTADSPQVQQATEQCGVVGGNVSGGASTLQTSTHGAYTLGWTHGGQDSDWAELAIEVNGAH